MSYNQKKGSKLNDIEAHPSEKAAWALSHTQMASASLAVRLLLLDSAQRNTAATYVPRLPFSLLPLLINFSSDFLNTV